MTPHYIFCFLVIVMHSIYAMDSGEQNNSCHLAMMPPDVQTLIARYLEFHDRETDSEFIERANQLSATITVAETDVNNSEGWSMWQHKVAHSTNKFCTISAQDLYQELPPYGQRYYTKCTIFDKRKSLSPIIFDHDRRHVTRHAAISNDGNIIAIVQGSWDLKTIGQECHHDYSGFLKNVSTGESKEFEILPLYGIALCTFNKQGTKLILQSHKNSAGVRRHFIYPLCSDADHTKKTQKKLLDYLRQHRVCKTLTASLSTTPNNSCEISNDKPALIDFQRVQSRYSFIYNLVNPENTVVSFSWFYPIEKDELSPLEVAQWLNHPEAIENGNLKAGWRITKDYNGTFKAACL